MARQHEFVDGIRAAAAPQPTSNRRSLRLTRNAWPTFEAMAEPIWVYAASSPIDAPTPFEMMVCNTTTRLPLNDMRPPNSAFASIGSTERRA